MILWKINQYENLIIVLLTKCLIFIFSQNVYASTITSSSWQRYTIDNSSQGADGIRMQDINHDGLMDLVTGWEEGGVIRIYYNPGQHLVKQAWPTDTIANVSSPEDAVFVDINNDNIYEVVSSCEGRERSVYLHMKQNDETVKKDWMTQALPTLKYKAAWMFCLPLNIDDKNSIDLIVGAKGQNAELGWLQSPENPLELDQWKWQPFLTVSWIMSIEAHDMDSDGDLDILVSDRKPDHQSVFWLEKPNEEPHKTENWRIHEINQDNHEFMFLDYGDLDQDGFNDVVVATPKDGIVIYRGKDKSGQNWEQHSVPLPDNTGTGKAVRIIDWNLDGKNELIFSCEHASSKHGVGILSPNNDYWENDWQSFSVSGTEGTKFDLIQLIDLDQDNDLDVLTCEENENLGVIWYENPNN